MRPTDSLGDIAPTIDERNKHSKFADLETNADDAMLRLDFSEVVAIVRTNYGCKVVFKNNSTTLELPFSYSYVEEELDAYLWSQEPEPTTRNEYIKLPNIDNNCIHDMFELEDRYGKPFRSCKNCPHTEPY